MQREASIFLVRSCASARRSRRSLLRDLAHDAALDGPVPLRLLHFQDGIIIMALRRGNPSWHKADHAEHVVARAATPAPREENSSGGRTIREALACRTWSLPSAIHAMYPGPIWPLIRQNHATSLPPRTLIGDALAALRTRSRCARLPFWCAQQGRARTTSSVPATVSCEAHEIGAKME